MPLKTLFLGSDSKVLACFTPQMRVEAAVSFLISLSDREENHPEVFLGVRARSRYYFRFMCYLCIFKKCRVESSFQAYIAFSGCSRESSGVSSQKRVYNQPTSTEPGKEQGWRLPRKDLCGVDFLQIIKLDFYKGGRKNYFP